ncbi:DoxX family protein [Hymenobacter sp. GOD-10R]|uniref:DoxX family protein n=1 Tax=Hymenobacter sp. GOD-10R TaxID=3093922 RepID=UPI002D7771CB|nr:DoxX family protein [Hymenobacter sp. GOD-10R]WRQ31148.1 DoxX family protein [Hymenobacter sp. GOD-10R]
MNTALWVWQWLLAGLFLLTGALKLVLSAAKVRQLAPAYFSLAFLRGLGVVELLGAVGIIGPALTGLWPVLTPLAAAGMSVVLAAAVAVHTQRRDFGTVPFLLLMLVGALAVTWGRWP